MSIEWLNIGIICTVLVLILLAIYMLSKKVKIDSEVQRKIFHVLMGIILSMLPFILKNKISVVILGILGTSAMELFKLPQLIKTIGKPLYGVRRKSLGEIFFAIAMIFTYCLADGNKLQYMLPMLILTFSDSLSALIGKKFGVKKLNVRAEKTLAGSNTFFITTFIISLIMLRGFSVSTMLITSLIISLVTTLIESICVKGTDNVFIPLSAYLTIAICIGPMPDFLSEIANMYVVILTPILAGIANMIFCKMNVLKKLQKPIDGGKNIFGNNKTFKGFIGYIIFNIFFQVLLGICIKENMLYEHISNSILSNILIGFTFGFAYAICELPNSYIKRKLGILPGKRAKGKKKIFFFALDQIDSVIGVVFVVALILNLNAVQILEYIALGTVTHIVINIMLYRLNLRKNIV